jgi:uncharacterized membrane protein YqiK
MSEIDLTQQLFITGFGIILSAIVGLLIWYVKVKLQCIRQERDALIKKVDILDKRSFRIEKCLIIKAHMIDEQTKKAHPESTSQLEALVKEMLEDEKGNL